MTDQSAAIPSVAESWAAAHPSGAFARKAAVVLLLFGVTFGQRFCIPLGTFQISIVVPLSYLALYFLIASSQLRINTIAFLLYAATVTLMGAIVLKASDGKNSGLIGALALCAIAYAPVAFLQRPQVVPGISVIEAPLSCVLIFSVPDQTSIPFRSIGS